MPRKGEKMSEQFRERQRQAAIRQWENPAHREHMRQVLTGHVVSDEAREKIRLARTGKTLTVEHKALLAERSAKNWENPEYREKVRAKLNDPDVRVRIVAPDVVARRNAAHRMHWQQMPEDEKRARTERFTAAGLDASIRKKGPTSIELIVRSVLDALEIAYVAQKRIGRYLVDVYIPSRNLVIECDGDYWHSRPEVVVRDQIRDKWLTNQGYRVVRLKESVIRSDARTALAEVFASPLVNP